MDLSINAMGILAVVIAQKPKKDIGEIPPSKLIKNLSHGRSTLRYQIPGDLGQEFMSPSPTLGVTDSSSKRGK